MMYLNYKMVVPLCQIFMVISNISFKKKETLTGVPPIDVYINRTNNRLVFKIKGRYYARITNA